MYYRVLNCIKMSIVLDLQAIYGHFAGTPFIRPRLASVNKRATSVTVQLPCLRQNHHAARGETLAICYTCVKCV